jgi:calcineurin-like phosphoesterase family protein
MRFGILTDLHLGHTGEGHWHNRLLFDHASQIVRTAIQTLNEQALDAVYVLGDLTQDGQPAQLDLARDMLANLAAPWFVLPGNHDSALVRAGSFDQVFAGHLVQPYTRLGDAGIASLRERVSGGPYEEPLYQIDATWASRAEQGIRADCTQALVVLSHFPLLDERLWADHHDGKDAGHFLHGETQVMRLIESLSPACAARRRKAILLCGHEHWHHVSVSHNWIQCVTASLIEYPMEVRVFSLDGNALRITMLAVPTGGLSEQSIALESPATWVYGRAQDRDTQLTIDK